MPAWVPTFFEGVLELPTTLHGRWGGAIQTRDRTLATVLPRGFASYVWIGHPAWRQVDDERRAVPVRWADIAAHRGVELGRTSRFSDIAGPMVPGHMNSLSDTQGWTYPPNEGVMVERRSIAMLFALLGERSIDATVCHCGFWTGYGMPRSVQNVQFQSGYDAYWLHRTTFGSLARWWAERDETQWLGETPNMFWPDDESWFVAVPFNAVETYVGGDEGLLGAFTAARDLGILDAFEAKLSDPRC